MLNPDCYLSFGQKCIGLMKNWVGTEVERVIKSVCWVVMSVNV